MPRTSITFSDSKPPATLPLAGRIDDGSAKVQGIGLDFGGTGVDGDAQRPASIFDGFPVNRTARIVGNNQVRPSTPLTAYSPGDIIANITTSGITVPSLVNIVRANGGAGSILGGLLLSSGIGSPGMANAQIQVDLFSAAPTVGAGDNGAYSIATGAAYFLGSLITGQFTQGGDGAFGPLQVLGMPYIVVVPPATTIYYLLKTVIGFTPIASQTFTPVLFVAQD